MRAPLDDGIALFNERQFFEAHEVWEDAWRPADGEDRLLLHGLIQIAAGFHKVQCGQPAGAVALLGKGMEKLAAVGPDAARRLDLPSLLASAGTWQVAARRMMGTGSLDHQPGVFPVLPGPPATPWSGAIHTHIEIDADAGRVWEALTGFAAYPEWNPFLIAVRGEPVPGTRLAVETRFPGGRLMRFRPLVLRADPRRELRWGGRSSVRGLLVPILRRTHLDATRKGFELMNAALKARVDRNSPRPATG